MVAKQYRILAKVGILETGAGSKKTLRDQTEIVDTQINKQNICTAGSKTNYLARGCQNAITTSSSAQAAPDRKSQLFSTSAVGLGWVSKLVYGWFRVGLVRAGFEFV